jgi:AraC family transcriptional regulator
MLASRGRTGTDIMTKPLDPRVSRAMRMLEQLMSEDIDYERVAAAVGLSLYRFHHLFAEEASETPGEYLRRIRLDAAALQLRWTRERVGRIAGAVGYASQSSFNKVFEKRYGMRPIEFRKDRERFPNDPTDSVPDKRVRLVESPGFRLLAKRYVGTPCFVPDYWADFLSLLPEGLDSQKRHLFVGVLRDDMRFTPPEQVRYDCCVTVSEAYETADIPKLWPELSLITLEPRLCASMHYKGYYSASDAPGEAQSISHAYSHLLDCWMTEGRYSFAGDYAAEIYAVPHASCPPQDLECTILAPVA